MTIQRTSFILKILISLICLLILILPYYAGEEGMTRKNYWDYDSILHDILLMIIYLPFIILWVVYLFFQTNTWSSYLVYGLLIYSLIIFLIVMADLLLGFFELLPITSRQISILIFPFMLLYFFELNLLKRNRI